MVIRDVHVGELLKNVGKAIWKDNILTIAAAVAYNFFFSLFPLMLFAAPLLALVGDKQQLFNWIMMELATSVPPAAFELLSGVAKDVVFADNAPGLLSVGAVLTLYSASNIFGSLMGALNIAYHVRNDRRPWWKQRLIQLGMVIVAGGLLTIAAAVMIAGPDIVNLVSRVTHLSGVAKWGWMILQYPLAFAFLVTAFWLMYYILPDFPQHKRQILVGASVAAVLWVVATTLFRQYVIHFQSFNKAYGTIGGVLLLLSWMYYSMVVVLAGGELNSELAKGSAEAPDKPKSEYDKEVAAAQSERAKEDRKDERKNEVEEIVSAEKREDLAKEQKP